MATFNGGVTSTSAASTISQLTAKFADGTAGAPTIAFDNSTTTGLFKSNTDVIGITVAGTETYRLDANTFDTPKLQVDTTLGSTTPFFKVDPTTNNVLIGPDTNPVSYTHLTLPTNREV